MELFAYIDPGTGSLIVQAVIGAVAGAVFFLRHQIRVFIGKVKNLFSKTNKVE